MTRGVLDWPVGSNHYISPKRNSILFDFVLYFAPQKQPNIVEHILCRASEEVRVASFHLKTLPRGLRPQCGRVWDLRVSDPGPQQRNPAWSPSYEVHKTLSRLAGVLTGGRPRYRLLFNELGNPISKEGNTLLKGFLPTKL
jgi:hypothetical protein